MSDIKYVVPLFAIFAICSACNKEKVDITIVQTGEVYNIDSTNVTFTARLLNRSDQIIEYGFKWDLDRIQRETPESYTKSILGDPDDDYFELTISSSLQKGKIYFVRAYVKTSKGTSLGRFVSFTAMGSEAIRVIGFEPDTATWGDTITICGKNFGYNLSDARVTASGNKLPIINLSDSTIQITISSSYNLIKAPLLLTIMGNSCITSGNLVLAPPEIHSFIPDTAGFNSLVTLNGKNFHPSNKTTLYINGITVTPRRVSNNTISFLFPSLSVGDCIFKVNVLTQNVTSQGKFYNSGPRIRSFEPISGNSGTMVTIKGNFFVAGFSTVKLDEVDAKIESLNDTIIKFTVPNNIQGGQLDLKVIVDNKPVIASQKFDRLAPVIADFSPDTATYGDTITIYGERFSDIPSENIVKFGNFPAEIVTASKEILRVKVPDIYSHSNCKLYLILGSETSTIGNSFFLKPPVIDDFFPRNATFNDTITILARYLHPMDNKISINLGGITAFPVKRNSNVLKVLVSPAYVSDGGLSSITLKSDIFSSVSTDKFQLITPVIDSISPFSNHFGDTVILYGKYLNPDRIYSSISSIKINETVSILSASNNKITFSIPNATDGLHTLNYTTGGITISRNNALLIKNPFTDYPLWETFYERSDAFSFTIGNKLYIGCGKNSRAYYGDILEFNPITKSWTSIHIDGRRRIGATGFSIGLKGYCLYENKLFEFDPVKYTWIAKADYPGNALKEHSVFVLYNKAYIAAGLDINSLPVNEFWEYNPELDSWTKKADYPGGNMAHGIGFAVADKGYVGFGTPNQQYLWEYDPAFDIWSEKCKIPALVTNISYNRVSAVCFTINEKAYIGTGYSEKSYNDYFNDLYEFDPVTNRWKLLSPIPFIYGFARANAFSIGSKGYIIGGDGPALEQWNIWIMNSELLK